MCSPGVAEMLLNFFGIIMVPQAWWAIIRHAGGNLAVGELDFILERERSKAFNAARLLVLIYDTTVTLSFYLQSFLPLMLVGLPALYGVWHMVLTGLTQHIGLAEDVLDLSLNCRTMYLNPIRHSVN